MRSSQRAQAWVRTHRVLVWAPRLVTQATLASVVLLGTLIAGPAVAQSSAEGDASAISIQMDVVALPSVAVGPLPRAVGQAPPSYNVMLTEDSVSVPGVFDAGEVTAHVETAAPAAATTLSDASAANVDLSLGTAPLTTMALTADEVRSEASIGGVCDAGLDASGNTTIANGSLRVGLNTIPLDTNPLPNQVVFDSAGR